MVPTLNAQDPLIASISLPEIQHRYVYPDGLGETKFLVPHLVFVDLPTVIRNSVGKEFDRCFDIDECLKDHANPAELALFSFSMCIPDCLLPYML